MDLEYFEGQVVVVSGIDVGGPWIYSAEVVEVASPLISQLVLTLVDPCLEPCEACLKKLNEAGMVNWKVPELTGTKRIGALARHAAKAHQKRRPFLSASSDNIAECWHPRPSEHWGVDPNAQSSAIHKRKKLSSAMQLIRHRLTWGFSHIAAGCLGLADLVFYITLLTEFGDVYGFEFMAA